MRFFVKFRKGYKYQLAEDELFQTEFYPRKAIDTVRIKLDTDGRLLVKEGYAWDGRSGWLNFKTTLRASLVHDALYQLMRMEELDHNDWRKADKEYSRVMKQDGAFKFNIKKDMLGLKLAGGKHAHPKRRKKVYKI